MSSRTAQIMVVGSLVLLRGVAAWNTDPPGKLNLGRRRATRFAQNGQCEASRSLTKATPSS